MTQTIAYLDCQAGISAEMLLAALLDTGLSLEALRQRLATFPVQGYQLRQSSVRERGLSGSCLTTFVEPQARADYTLTELAALYQDSSLPPRICERALAILQRLTEAGALVQGIPAVDSHIATNGVIAIIAVLLALDILNISTLYASPLPLGSGHIQTSQGLLPVPAPLTLEVLRRVRAPWKTSPIEAELVTPIGAALLAELAHFDLPIIAIERVGYGFGEPSPACLRLCIGKAYDSSLPAEEVETDWVSVLETHIDNMSGEILGGLMDRLLAAGALDVSYTPMQMKKNRPATLLRVICQPEEGEALALLLLRETSTLGVRIQQMQRRKAQRSQQQIITPLGPMLIKIKRLGAHVISAAPEYEECQRLATEHNLPLADVYRVAHEAIQTVINSPRKTPGFRPDSYPHFTNGES